MTDFFDLDVASQVQRLEAAARAALQRWNMSGCELHLIKYRENAVFRVDCNGMRRALRLHRHGYHSDDELRSELQWMQALRQAGITVPTIVPAASGDLFVTHAASDLPGDIQVDLFEWIDGEQLGSIEAGITDDASVAETYRTIGELAGRVHNQAVSWQLPPGLCAMPGMRAASPASSHSGVSFGKSKLRRNPRRICWCGAGMPFSLNSAGMQSRLARIA